MPETLRIVFMGTPEFAVPCLKVLHNSRHELSLVVAQPDRPKGRGRKVLPGAVKQAAVEMGLDVIQPVSFKDETVAKTLASTAPDLFVVVAYGLILPGRILSIPKRGAVNIHPSLLPKYRGPSPIQWAIVNMEKETGVTSIFMDEGMDSGDIILSYTEPISETDTAADLHDRLALRGADLLLRTLELIEHDTVNAVPQDHSKATFAPLLKKEHGKIDWNQPAVKLRRFVNGMTPWPGAYTFLDGRRYRLLEVEPVSLAKTSRPGTVVGAFPGELVVAASEGGVSIKRIQAESAKPLPIEDFLRGHTIPEGAVFS
ncbi:MAG: methionyl-tRNA formyltransferase [Desulfococcus sp. 4484_241]|nr:MAG: methionyl-tRNA formyltransferase [Desulfococcus sp. 4484_241]